MHSKSVPPNVLKASNKRPKNVHKTPKKRPKIVFQKRQFLSILYFAGDRQVLQASTLLANLLTANDDGLTCPNPSFAYILKKNCVENLTDLGFMFYWAQNLCGLKFPAKTETEFEDEMSNFVEKVVESIRSRLKSRIYLQREISQLEKSKLISVDLDVPKSLSSQFPSKISSILRFAFFEII